ncbi:MULTISPECIES: P63C domain-containing protein [Paraburkholderia]|uniref:P63C domain-containing protein n=1 Tax=Paraburkholderia TaxID=1822464 RepID=UPI00224E6772|nr:MULTISPECIES: P63C domain-containing protein [Paraburkholderia]MCX4159637.1 P63C domain-containing protein [Paraburkholderia aspalathi]MDN7169035.1 P63C domain-containing protein [Paraburkholderia sp. SECH2]MDQ6397522.1 P63C domain-containing protein [Paraburkholderia aspalathi]
MEGGKKKQVAAKKAVGRAKGGVARAKALSNEERSLIAKKAATARWGEKPLLATHKGNFKEEFGLNVDCYVLNDEHKSAVISQRGMGAALGLGDGGARLPRFVSGKTISEYVGPELREKLEKPVIFQAQVGGPETLSLVHGYDVTILIQLCKVIIAAETDGKLLKSQEGFARQAHIILGASANAGITGLVYALAGYRPEVEEVISAFKAFVQEEARKYEQEFPSELYMEWHRLYQIPVPVRGKPWQLRHLTVKHVYYPLAKSNGKILDLVRALKAQDGDRQKKLFQFLNDVGTRALRMHMGRVLEMAESSKTKEQYEAKIVDRFGGQQELDLAGD